MWHSWGEEQAAEQAEHAAQEKQDRSINYKQVVVTDVQDTLRFAAQNFDDGALNRFTPFSIEIERFSK